MKKSSLLLVSVFVYALLFTNHANGQQRDPVLTRSFNASSIEVVEVITSNSSITMNGDAGSQAVVEVYASRNNWTASRVKQVLEENYTIEIKVERGKLYVEVKTKGGTFNRDRQGLNISLRLSVPNRVNTNLSTSNASIQIGSLSGFHDIKTSNGSVKIDHVSGKILGRTSNGSITVTNANDDIDLKTSNGSITVKDCYGKTVMQTSNGSVNLSNLSGFISATTSNGSVKASAIKGELKVGTSNGSVNINDVSGSVDARTSNSSMNVTMESVSDYVKLTNSGSLSLTLPAGHGYNLNVRANRIETSGLADFRGNTSSTNLEGTVGRGGALIEVRTSQRVSLSFR